jgi:hypothetical protein
MNDNWCDRPRRNLIDDLERGPRELDGQVGQDTVSVLSTQTIHVWR